MYAGFPQIQGPLMPGLSQQSVRNKTVRVNGRGGAEAFPLGPDSDILMLDNTAPLVWLKITDGAGYPSLTAYEITPAKTQEQKEASRLEALEQRLTNLEVAIRGKSDSGDAGA